MAIWLKLIENNSGNGDILPFHYYDIMHNNTPVGKISLRFGNNFHSYYNGHVGFEVYPAHRGCNFAYEACVLVLEIAKEHGIDSLYLTCAQSNKASRRIFEKLGADYVETAAIPQECFFYRNGIEDYAIYSKRH